MMVSLGGEKGDLLAINQVVKGKEEKKG